eukprot:6239629-Pyramimonas_sp.AAC.1
MNAALIRWNQSKSLTAQNSSSWSTPTSTTGAPASLAPRTPPSSASVASVKSIYYARDASV